MIPRTRPADDHLEIESDRFREIMRCFPTGVTVITACRQGEKSVGFTANAVASTSLNPPLILVSMANQLYSLSVVRETSLFAVNFLSEGQEAIARWFATSSDDPKFLREAADAVGLRHSHSARGLPIVRGAVAHAECSVEDIFPGGDHSIVVGRVVDGIATQGTPLMYFRNNYGKWPDPT
jgi:flavin reductase